MVKDTLEKSLVALLVLSIVLSISTTLFNFSKLNLLGYLTGFATTDTGTVTFKVNESTSIVLKDNSVNFGTCILNNSGYITYSSNITNGTTTTGFFCDGLSSGEDYMILENNGNVNVSVTLRSNVNGPGFTNSPTNRGEFWFAAADDEPGSCSSGLANDWVNISQASTDYTVCSLLNSFDDYDSLKVWYRIVLPDDTPSGETRSATITFSAVKV